MIRQLLLVLALAVAGCGGDTGGAGGSGGTGGGGSGGTGGGGGTSAPQDLATPADMTVANGFCGGTTCTGGTTCCAFNGTLSCMASCPDGGLSAQCQKPTDCPGGATAACCITIANYMPSSVACSTGDAVRTQHHGQRHRDGPRLRHGDGLHRQRRRHGAARLLHEHAVAAARLLLQGATSMSVPQLATYFTCP